MKERYSQSEITVKERGGTDEWKAVTGYRTETHTD